MDSDVTVQEVIDREYVGVSESDEVADTASLLLQEGAEVAVVLRGNDAVGVVTERDLLARYVDGDPSEETVAEVMAESMKTVAPDATIAEAADILSTGQTKRLVVTDGAEPLGVLTEHDLVTTSLLHTERESRGVDEQEQVLSAEAGGRAEGGVTETEAGYEDQAICEACGSLARDLMPFNGQLLCSDCRDI